MYIINLYNYIWVLIYYGNSQNTHYSPLKAFITIAHYLVWFEIIIQGASYKLIKVLFKISVDNNQNTDYICDIKLKLREELT